MPGTALGSDLKHAALEGRAVPVKEESRKRPHRIRGDVAGHGDFEFDRNASAS